MGKRKEKKQEKKQAKRDAKQNKKQRRGSKPETRQVVTVDARHNPLYPDRIESDAMGVLIALVSVVVAIILLAVIVMNFSYAANPRSSSDKDSYVTEDDSQATAETKTAAADTDEAEDTEDIANSKDTDEQETDLSTVDIDAVTDTYAQFTGTLTDSGDAYVVAMPGAYDIYAYNDAGETVVMEEVNQIVLSEIGSWDIAAYTGKEVTVGGYLEVSGQDMTMALVDFEGPELEDTAIHTYQIMINDCTWTEAMQLAQERGGYLVRINSQEEYDAIISQLSAGDYSKYHFYLGGRRDSDGTDYYWVDTDNQFIGDCLNSSDSWCQSAWYDGEPSYADGDVAEDAMNLFCVGGTWYLNDSSMDLVGNYPDLLTGKVGYIIEFE